MKIGKLCGPKMEVLKRGAALGGIVLGAGVLSAGCSGAAEETRDSIRIGVSLYRGDDTFINNIRQELEKCAKTWEQ